jgi:ketosteroid isomerase-like protein
VPTADRAELSELVARYAHCVDTRDFDSLREVFTSDAVLVTSRGERRGLDEIQTAMNGLRRYEATFHFVGQSVFSADSLDAARAFGETLCEAHHVSSDDDQRTNRVMYIRYHDRYHRTTAGWRISARRLEVPWTETRQVDR